MNIKTAGRKAYKATDVAKLDALLDQRRKWGRRFTIATTKLAAVEQEIIDLAKQLANEKAGVTDDTGTKTT